MLCLPTGHRQGYARRALGPQPKGSRQRIRKTRAVRLLMQVGALYLAPTPSSLSNAPLPICPHDRTAAPSRGQMARHGCDGAVPRISLPLRLHISRQASHHKAQCLAMAASQSLCSHALWSAQEFPSHSQDCWIRRPWLTSILSTRRQESEHEREIGMRIRRLSGLSHWMRTLSADGCTLIS